MAKREMTAEEKEQFKKRMAESRAKKSESEKDKQIEALKKQIEELSQKIANANVQSIVKVMDTEKVHFLWQAEVADDNILYLGEGGRYGRIVGKTGEVFIPKNELSNVLDEKTRWYIDNRWLLILDGLTDEERKAYNADYSEGEVLDKKAFAKLVEMGDKILEIYPKLCKAHKEVISKRYVEAYENNSPFVTREIVVKLNELSKANGKKTGDFVSIIERMNQKDLGEE